MGYRYGSHGERKQEHSNHHCYRLEQSRREYKCHNSPSARVDESGLESLLVGDPDRYHPEGKASKEI